MIQAQFGLPDIAVRTLEVYTTATLEATLAPPPRRPTHWRDGDGAAVGDRARRLPRRRLRRPAVHRILPRRDAGARARARCRSAAVRPRRGGDGGVESLRAIPWVFAWTQTRLLLPSWLGTGEALDAALARGERDAAPRDDARLAVLPTPRSI